MKNLKYLDLVRKKIANSCRRESRLRNCLIFIRDSWRKIYNHKYRQLLSSAFVGCLYYLFCSKRVVVEKNSSYFLKQTVKFDLGRVLISTHQGLFLLNRNSNCLETLISGKGMFGITRHKQRWYVSQIYKPHSFGRIISFELKESKIFSVREEYRTIIQYFHQSDVYRGFLYAIDSSWKIRGDRILKFLINDVGRLQLKKTIRIKGNDDKRMGTGKMIHLNSIYNEKGNFYLMYHNNTKNSGVLSKVVKVDKQFSVNEVIYTGGSCCHNIFFDKSLCFLDSMNARLCWNGEFVDLDNGFRKGLAVTDEFILVGNSQNVSRANRKYSESSVDVYDRHKLEKKETIFFPNIGTIHELRFVDKNEYGFSEKIIL